MWAMKDTVDKYRLLFDRFLSDAISVDEFQTIYLSTFKDEEHLDERIFELLDQVFADVDSYTHDSGLLNEKPGFHLDEASLRRKIENAASRLSEMGSNGITAQ
jgi:Bacterial self-protective colicin-like immunity